MKFYLVLARERNFYNKIDWIMKRIGIGDTLNKVVNVINPIYFNDVYEAQATTRFTIEWEIMNDDRCLLLNDDIAVSLKFAVRISVYILLTLFSYTYVHNTLTPT